MPTPFLLAAAACAVAVALLLRAEHADDRRGVWRWKPLASLAFILAALACGATRTTYGRDVLVALVLAFAGDVLLIPHAPRAFLAGLTSFLLGHLAYAAAFWVHGLSWAWVAGSAVPLLGAVAVVLPWLWPHVPREMRGPVVAYVSVITVMVALAAGTVGAGASWWILVGAVLFFASDLSVARDRFVARGFVNRAWGLPAYYAAQVILAATVAMRSDA